MSLARLLDISAESQRVRRPRARRRLHEGMVAELSQGIARGELAAGSQLPPEPQLAEACGVSRTVVREAIQALVHRGLVTVDQGRGTIVSPPEAWDQLDPIVLRVRLEIPGGERLFD